jgi:hypothetical protein
MKMPIYSFLGYIFIRGVQGGLGPIKTSGVGTNFGLLLVHVLPDPNKQRSRKQSMILS